MNTSKQYFKLARAEETSGHLSSALLLYVSSFCAGFNNCPAQYPYQAAEKIRRLQLSLGLPDSELFALVHSYGPLSDRDCRKLLSFSISGDLTGINTVLAGYPRENGG